jgi:hypothetical protein
MYEQAKEEHLRATLLTRIILDLPRGPDVTEHEALLERWLARATPGATREAGTSD